MKIGILCTITNTFGRKGFYNGQEIGLGKALVAAGHRVIIYKSALSDTKEETISLCKGLRIRYIHLSHVGVHGYINCHKYINKDLDAILCFADTQIFLPHVIEYCRKYDITFVPYIGTAGSQDDQSFHGHVMNILFSLGTLRQYRKMPVLSKTENVRQDLLRLGVKNVDVAPVGIDFSLLKQDFREADRAKLRAAFGYEEADRIICCVGKLVEVKQPVRLIEIMNRLVEDDLKKLKLAQTGDENGASADDAESSGENAAKAVAAPVSHLRMVIVGEGVLKPQVEEKIRECHLENYVKIIDRVPYENMWQIYTMSDYFLNVSRREVFGMAVMEAIYYETAVAAAPASGPVAILQGMPGHRICNSDEEFAAFIEGEPIPAEVLRETSDLVVKRFTWGECAGKFLQIAERRPRVIINSDDFGQTHSCTEAIAEAFRQGLITDTTMVANGEAFDEACRLIFKDKPIEDIEDRIGIHFVLSENEPLTEEIKKCHRLTKDGKFRRFVSRNSAYFMPLTGKEKKAIYLELTAQAKRIKDAGIKISHADSHHHVHMNFQVAPIFARVCKEQGITNVRIHQNLRFKSPLRQWMFERYNAWLSEQGFKTTDHFENLPAYNALPEGYSEIMVHADYDTEHRLIDRVKREGENNIGEDLEQEIRSLHMTDKSLSAYKEI